MEMYLTEKQKRVYDYIKHYIQANDRAPSYSEIKEHFQFKSLSTVFDYITMLERKNCLARGGAQQKRSLRLIDSARTALAIPLVGIVAAGAPIDSQEVQEYLDVPESLLAQGENVALRIKGDSMMDSGICDNDVIVVKKQKSAENGQIVVALVDSRATIKRVYFHRDTIELRPSNPDYQPLVVTRDQDFEIYGVLVGLYRSFK